MTLIRHLAALRPGSMTSTVASAKAALRAIARRAAGPGWPNQDPRADLGALTAAQAPAMLEVPGIATGTAAEMLILVGDSPQRIRSEVAFAKLCGVCPTGLQRQIVPISVEPRREPAGQRYPVSGHDRPHAHHRRPSTTSASERPRVKGNARSFAA